MAVTKLADQSSATPPRKNNPVWLPGWLASAIAVSGLTLPLLSSAARGQMGEPVAPIPLEQHLDARKVELGEVLFNDNRLSGDGSMTCSSCHHLGAGGADDTALSFGVGHVKLRINTPTVFNSGFNFVEDWDGRADTLEQQAILAMIDPTIMAANFPALEATLTADAKLAPMFNAIYPDGARATNVADALAAFQRSLSTPNARFDKYLRGDKSALTSDEVTGYALFKSYGCVSCHQGVNIGGNMFQVLGVAGPPGAYFKDRGHLTAADLGRFNVTGEANDKFVFKVPSLRNVALTAPYLHDGTATTLEQAVNVMFKYQLGRKADPHDVALIIKFLGTLTGQYKGLQLTDGDTDVHE